MVSRTFNPADIPNVPGFRKSRAAPKTMGQNLKLHHGIPYVLDPVRTSRPTTAPASFASTGGGSTTSYHYGLTDNKNATSFNDLSGRYSMRQRKQDRENKTKYLPFGETSKLPTFVEFGAKVLHYVACYTEKVHQSALEDCRVRECAIYFYLEDGTIEMHEHATENSGIPQGVFLRRHQLKKKDGSVVTPRDMTIGSQLEVYGKTMKILSCDKFTEEYYETYLKLPHHSSNPSQLEIPEDRYNVTLRERMMRETGSDMSVRRNRKMHPMKQFMEAQLGQPQTTQDLSMFLEKDQQVLRFMCVWDDTDTLFGTVNELKMHYFLSNDTIEILNVRKNTNGFANAPKMLARRKLPKDPKSCTQGDHGDNLTGHESEYWHWTDLYFGCFLEIFSANRVVFILDADDFTKSFFKKHDVDIGVPQQVQKPPMQRFEYKVPAYNGFGSEEDSLRSVYSIRPQAAQKDVKKQLDSGGRILRYMCRMVGGNVTNADRRFTVKLFLEDSSLAIRETEMRNSGFMGGNFLNRSKVKKSGTEYYQPSDFYVGATLTVNSQTFSIVEADEHTLRYMEAHREEYELSSIEKIMQKISCCADAVARRLTEEKDSYSMISLEKLRLLLLKFIDLEFQEFITITRKLTKIRKTSVHISKVFKLMADFCSDFTMPKDLEDSKDGR
mmetsp:Transcript_23173/g.31684  ORF Transcript_23173/g.31684 Transcript_23173/m.31684 type:complete len:667 (-) Transcript_23173:849-2849(-)